MYSDTLPGLHLHWYRSATHWAGKHNLLGIWFHPKTTAVLSNYFIANLVPFYCLVNSWSVFGLVLTVHLICISDYYFVFSLKKNVVNSHRTRMPFCTDSWSLSKCTGGSLCVWAPLVLRLLVFSVVVPVSPACLCDLADTLSCVSSLPVPALVLVFSLTLPT